MTTSPLVRGKSMKRVVGTVGVMGVMVSMTLIATAPATAAPAQKGCDSRTNNTQQKLLECVRVDGVVEHLQAFQAIADAHGGTRADQTPGYDASVEYVVDVLEAAGWSADVVPFTYDAADIVLRQLTPVAADYVANDATGTGEGDVTGTVIPVDINLTGDRANSSGCEESDFAGLNFSGPNDIALIQRGTCPFGQKAQNAQTAGAEAVILFNQGDSVGDGDRFGPVNPTLGAFTAAIPVVGTSFDAGVALAAPGSTAQVKVDFYEATSHNVIGELAGKNASNVVMAGAHLDSVPAGPGINDNGSGSAALLEVAQQMAKTKPQNTVRFAWWGAEELGLIGSTEWVQSLNAEQRAEIALYLNFDMIGSPNYYFGIYDANESSFVAPVVVPEGSTDIEQTFEEFYTLLGEPYDDSAFSGRSDYSEFIEVGIPSGGLFTGAEQVKTAQQEAIWGGTAGEWFDPCYHQACDTIDNIDVHALEVNSDAVAYAVSTYAASTESVNGVKGVKIPGNFPVPAPAGPEHTFAGPLGGDDHGHDHDRHYDSE
ncbi:M28 family metallopeptidase [Microbacterium atlanticum]|uniref:M28 family metallopeptidase n=1 Tax=Microbacterium atlanticum TaxID=2782168 RepID=UPI001E287820|nr:M28 family metallopeptidase [Microbacterium atlanticum]